MKVSAAYLERVARQWQDAFSTANGKTAPIVEWSNGWFVIKGKRYRRAALEEMRNRLIERAATRDGAD